MPLWFFTKHHQSLVISLAVATSLAMWPATGRAHDASSWGGLFRSRDGGTTWFQASVGKVMGAALAVAIDPNDPNRLLLGSDSGLLESRNGGLDWDLVGADVLVGAVLAVAFDHVGKVSLAASGSTLAASYEDGHWLPMALPIGAAPVRSLVEGGAPNTFYLLGWRGLFRTEDGGRTWLELDAGLPDATVTRLLVNSQIPTPTLVAVVGGDVWLSRDTGGRWESRRAGLPPGQIQTTALDPHEPGGLWAAGANAVFASTDAGSTWRRVGSALPDPDTEIRGIAVDARDRQHVVVSTHRGLYATQDGASTWDLLGDNLPGHIEAGPLVPDQKTSTTLYAGFSVTPYQEAWRNAVTGSSSLARLSPSEVLGAAAFVALLGLGAGLALRWLGQRSRPRLLNTREPAR
jgi:photosystem II stability/assembly factor-like uncharacterized protein